MSEIDQRLPSALRAPARIALPVEAEPRPIVAHCRLAGTQDQQIQRRAIGLGHANYV